MIFTPFLGRDHCANSFCTLLFTQIWDAMASDHVNGNGTEEPMDTSSAAAHSENFQALLQAGLPQKVAEKLDEIYIAGENAVITTITRRCSFTEPGVVY